jgi:hypothetical protein
MTAVTLEVDSLAAAMLEAIVSVEDRRHTTLNPT